jgi:general secretion pathway protein D
MFRKFLITLALAATAAAQQQQPAPQPAPALGGLSLQNASLTEVIDLLARQLKINYILDPAVKGSVILNTYGETRNLDPRNLLELILRINGAGMVQVGELYRIVQLKDIARQPLKPEVGPTNIPEDDQTMLNLIFLKYVTVDELSKVLQEFTGENARLYSYAPANLLFIMDSRRNMRRTMDLISLFDSDTFANERVRLFEVKNSRPSDIVKELDGILKSISLDTKTSTVRFLPVDRINTLIAVAPNPGVFETVAMWLNKLDVPVKITVGGDYETHVYRVKYQRADCLAQALGQLFGFGGGYGGYGAGYPASYAPPVGIGGGAAGYGGAYGAGGGGGYVGGYGGGYGSGFGGYGAFGGGANPGGYGNANAFSNGFGGTGACGAGSSGGYGGGYGGGYPGGYGYGAPYGTTGYAGMPAYGYPTFGGFSAQAPAPTAVTAAGQPATAAAADRTGTYLGPAAADVAAPPRPPRIVPNPLDNALLIQADAQQYANIEKVLKELDIPPRQILLEAKIYSVDLTQNFASGIQAALQAASAGGDRKLSGFMQAGTGVIQLNAGALVSQSRQLLAFLNLQENSSRAHVLSEPSLIATDSIPASINVGAQIPVSTGQTTIPTGGNVAVTQTISAENTGVTMQVNARINPSGVVTLIINQQISAPVPGTAGNLTPSFSQQVIQTQITLQDGDTIAVGGLISENVTTTSGGIPLLNKLPWLGVLFGSKTYSKDHSELIIFMTPHVIYDETNLYEASDELKSRVKAMRKLIRDL